jgi:hypothetical protein
MVRLAAPSEITMPDQTAPPREGTEFTRPRDSAASAVTAAPAVRSLTQVAIARDLTRGSLLKTGEIIARELPW